MTAPFDMERAFGAMWQSMAKSEGHKPTPKIWPGEHGTGIPTKLLEILECLEPGREYTTAQVHAATGFDKTPLSENLRRMFKFGLVTRRAISGNTFAYRIKENAE